ncbi:hypothetical protein [Pedobacter frigoris]|uniref:Uncharacterized protein n=1 Tax=Pedobacter frigoris TaxID=2571272 RepID=A0A4U1CA76_9SPHI|nr:hypothetical protein [Pedobacter frigoris]TKC02856.1 hypothetical protein FA047_20090 [Pedobacter frigoris]
MKLSTMLFIAAFLLYIGTLAAHNFSLKTTYLSGNHKKRFNDHQFKALSGISELYVKTGNALDIQVEYGAKEGIWLGNRIRDDVKVVQSGASLTIDVVMNEKNKEFGNSSSEIVIILNHLNKLRTFDYPRYDKAISDRVGEIYLKNLKEKQFDIVLSDQFRMVLDSCQFRSLKAVVGDKGRSSTLQIMKENKIDTATFDIRGGSFLELNNAEIARLNYKLSDSSKVFMVGKSIKALQKQL